MKIVNIIGIMGLVVLAVLIVFALTRYSSIRERFAAKVTEEFKKQSLATESVLEESDIAHLPVPVRKYLAYTGAIGKSKMQNVRIELAAEMI